MSSDELDFETSSEDVEIDEVDQVNKTGEMDNTDKTDKIDKIKISLHSTRSSLNTLIEPKEKEPVKKRVRTDKSQSIEKEKQATINKLMNKAVKRTKPVKEKIEKQISTRMYLDSQKYPHAYLIGFITGEGMQDWQ